MIVCITDGMTCRSSQCVRAEYPCGQALPRQPHSIREGGHSTLSGFSDESPVSASSLTRAWPRQGPGKKKPARGGEDGLAEPRTGKDIPKEVPSISAETLTQFTKLTCT